MGLVGFAVKIFFLAECLCYVTILLSYFLQLRKAVVDHVSDSFLETNVPLLVLIEAAKAGDERGVEECAISFADHANKLVEVRTNQTIVNLL